jgi:hypothetical protein
MSDVLREHISTFVLLTVTFRSKQYKRKILLRWRGYSGYTNASQCYVTLRGTLLILFHIDIVTFLCVLELTKV